MHKKLLIIESERDIAELMSQQLCDRGYQVTIVLDGPQGLELARTGDWNLVVLDLHLPGIDGLEVCREIRQASRYVPVLIVSSRCSELDRVLGLELGADDYLGKPFCPLEFVARVKAILRRFEAARHQSGHASRLRVGELLLDRISRTTHVGDKSVSLTQREFELLALLLEHPGRVFRRIELLQKVWHSGHAGYEHTVNSHINRLRAKLETVPSKPTRIVTVWGVGYKLNPESGPQPLIVA